METTITILDKATMAKMAELAVDTVRGRLMEEFGDLIHDAVGDAVLEVLGEDFVDNLVDESEEAYLELMRNLTSRIAVVAVYSRTMKENTSTKVQFDINWDDYASPWAALVALWEDFDSSDEIIAIRRLPDSIMWPIFEVEFETEEYARAVIAKYLDVPDGYDDDVTEYLDA